mmetsp:Transcript_87674/g.283860  ORF Transcript_87674/g.283860 Transcript_87674/m.283860 type:complete len:234 (+) Transcript_87674:88-789(+)
MASAARALAAVCVALICAGAHAVRVDESRTAPAVPSWACPLADRNRLVQGTVDGAVRLHSQSASAAGAAAAGASEHVLRGAAARNASAQQPVQAVDAASLAALLREAKNDLLIVFYAPWCPHCRSFVMQDSAGNSANAPLELLNRDIRASNGPKVVKFNIEANARPDGFAVDYVPKIYFDSKSGSTRTTYQGNPSDLPSLKAWAMAGGPQQRNSGPVVTVLSGVDRVSQRRSH